MTPWRSLAINTFWKNRSVWSDFGIWLFAVVASGSFVAVRGLANDVWWDWLTGRWEVRHVAVLTRNIFTSDLRGLVWVNTEWAWGPIVYEFSRLGYWGLICMTVLGIAAFFGLLIGFSRWLRVGPSARFFLVLFAVGVSAGWWDFRPQVWAYPYAVGVLWWLFIFRRRLGSSVSFRSLWRWRWSFIGLSLSVVVWSSFHGSWILVLGWLVVEAISGSWSWRLFAVLWSVLLMSWVSIAQPWGGVYVLHAVSTASSPAIAGSIGEWFSPNFHQLPVLALFLVYAFGSGLVMLRRSTSADLRSWLYVVGFGAGALYGVRFFPYLALGMVVALTGLQSRAVPRFVSASFISLALVVSGLAVVAVPTSSFFGSVAKWGEPVASVDWLVAHHVHRVFSMDSWGGYVEARGLRPWIDGRADFWLSHGSHFQQYGYARLGAVSPVRLVRRSGDRWALVSPLSSFYWSLRQAGWQVREHSRLGVVLAAPARLRSSGGAPVRHKSSR